MELYNISIIESEVIFEQALSSPFCISPKFLNTIFTISTDSILQADNRGGEMFSKSCRESMVRNCNRQVVEYPSRCLAADRTTLRPSSFCLNKLCLTTSAKQGYSFPKLIQEIVALIDGLQDLLLEEFKKLATISRYGG